MAKPDLRAVLAAEKADALAAVSASKLSKERTDAMDYYMGDVTADIPNELGKSSAVSTDVADTIEGLMPSLMEIFASGDECVRFAPVGQEDVEAAEQETDYVNHVFMHQNPGFLVLYSFIKDALLSKVGVVKVWTEEEKTCTKETYRNQPMESLAVLTENKDYELVEHTANEDGTHDITVECTKTVKRHRVEPVPPEEFGIARRAKSIKDATYCFHESPDRTVGELIEQGYDEDQVNALPSEDGISSTEQSARDSVDETRGSAGDEGLNKTTRPVKVTEHYIRMDYEGNGKPALYRVVTGGDQGEVLKRNGKEDVEQVEAAPFAAMTPVIITHRFFGRSIADLVMDIQRIKTALLRGMLNNLYLHNNPRVEVAQSHISDQTLDDLLVSRPGGIVRTKTPGGLQWQNVPDITTSIYPALEYFDATREWRTGVTRQGQGIDASALQNQSATAALQGFTAAQARMRLIARIFAETGIKDLFALLHMEIRKNGDQAQTARLRNKWVQVDPRDWKARNDMTIDVGLGDGGKQQQLNNIMALIGMQKEALASGMTNLVSAEHLFNSAKEFTKIIGKKDVESFFSNPEGKPAPTPPPDPKLIELQMKAQLDQQAMVQKTEIEKLQAQADIATQDRKTQAEMALAEKKFALDRELKMIEAQVKVQEHHDNIAMQENKANLDDRNTIRKMKMEVNKDKVGPGQSINDEGEVGVNPELAQLLQAVLQSHAETQKAVSAPRKTQVVRGPDGKVSHAVSMVDETQH